MGCDIHIYVERKNNKEWEIIDGDNPWIAEYEQWVKNADTQERKENLLKSAQRIKKEEPKVIEGWIYNNRNYNLFSILADVRNYYNTQPIDMPRGLPEDISIYLKEESEMRSCDSHSHSWFTFNELLNYDWDNQYIENEGFVDEKTYKQFKTKGDPYPCCRGVGGRNVEKVLNYEMDRIIKNKYSWEENRSFYTAIRWKESYKEIAEEFLNNINEFIVKNNISYDELENYRIVFWFDN